jgi:DNA-nicking Smr family endonuclease
MTPPPRKKDKFGQSPFKDLKGFCASGPGADCQDPVNKRPDLPPEDEGFFSREMKRLGVKPQADAGEGMKRLPEQVSPVEAENRPEDTDEDRDLFLAALKEMGAVFRDELPESDNIPATPRRMKQLLKSRLEPEAVLDLHGHSRVDALAKARFFLENAIFHRRRMVLLITGRGRGSGGEAVLRDAMERLLADETGKMISEWGRAPKRLGGEGALVIFLKKSAGKQE